MQAYVGLLSVVVDKGEAVVAMTSGFRSKSPASICDYKVLVLDVAVGLNVTFFSPNSPSFV